MLLLGVSNSSAPPVALSARTSVDGAQVFIVFNEGVYYTGNADIFLVPTGHPEDVGGLSFNTGTGTTELTFDVVGGTYAAGDALRVDIGEAAIASYPGDVFMSAQSLAVTNNKPSDIEAMYATVPADGRTVLVKFNQPMDWIGSSSDVYFFSNNRTLVWQSGDGTTEHTFQPIDNDSMFGDVWPPWDNETLSLYITAGSFLTTTDPTPITTQASVTVNNNSEVPDPGFVDRTEFPGIRSPVLGADNVRAGRVAVDDFPAGWLQ